NAVDPPVAERTVERLAQRDRGVRRALLGDLHPDLRRAIVVGGQPGFPLVGVGAGQHGVVHVVSRVRRSLVDPSSADKCSTTEHLFRHRASDPPNTTKPGRLLRTRPGWTRNGSAWSWTTTRYPAWWWSRNAPDPPATARAPSSPARWRCTGRGRTTAACRRWSTPTGPALGRSRCGDRRRRRRGPPSTGWWPERRPGAVAPDPRCASWFRRTCRVRGS